MVFKEPRRLGCFPSLKDVGVAEVWMFVKAIGPLFVFAFLVVAESQLATGGSVLKGIVLVGVAGLSYFALICGIAELGARARRAMRINDEGLRLICLIFARKAAWREVTLVRFKPCGSKDEYWRIMVLYRASGIWRHYPGYQPLPLLFTVDKYQRELLLIELKKWKEGDPEKYALEIVEESAQQKSRRPPFPFWWLLFGWCFLIQGVAALIAGGVLLHRDASAGISSMWSEGILTWYGSFANGHEFGRFLLFAGAVSTAIGGACRWRFGVLEREADRTEEAKWSIRD